MQKELPLAPAQTEYEAAFNAGLNSATTVMTPEGGETMVKLAEGQTIESIQHLLAAPTRIKAENTFEDVDSFLRYVDSFRTPSTQIMAFRKSLRVSAILDYHALDAPSWCDHACHLQLVHSLQWGRWFKMNRQAITQIALAEFLEEQVDDVVDPVGAALLEMAMHLEATKSVAIKSQKRLSDGEVKFTYEEEVNGRSSKSDFSIPTKITINIPVFEGGLPIRIPLRLRYRIQHDALIFTLILENPEVIVKDAFKEVLDAIADETGLKPFLST